MPHSGPAAHMRALRRRLRYLIAKRDQRMEQGRPYDFLTDEIVALEWALPILDEHRR